MPDHTGIPLDIESTEHEAGPAPSGRVPTGSG
jgi:hypothetical protein